MQIGQRVTKIGQTATWTVVSLATRGSVNIELDVRSGAKDEIYARRLTLAAQRDWTIA